jgi:predicted DNA-binding transcriptional regulator AlpA
MTRKKTTTPPVRVDLTNDSLLSRPQAARVLGLSQKTLRTWSVDRVGPPFVKAGAAKQARVFYRRSDLETWLAGRLEARNTTG